MATVLAMFATMGFAAPKQKVIGYYMDNSDDFYKAGFQVFSTLAKREGWKVVDIVGQGTAPDQLQAVENFITQRVDALVVVQNSPKTTSECLKLAKAAGIPEFHLTHNPPNEPGLTGFAGYDWVTLGEIAGRSAIAHNVKRVIMIEGKLGQGTASGQTMGFLAAYKQAGKDIASRAPAARTSRWCSGPPAAGSPIPPRRPCRTPSPASGRTASTAPTWRTTR
jgi:ABC-type sugar transport system substrate-binding protein